jgi:cyclophilin family peptidyl-prolyl cis-trans isomerase
VLETNSDQKELLNVAALGAFVTNDYERVERYYEDAKKANALAGKALELELQIPDYKALWEKEAEKRKAEAEANDLPRVKLETTKGTIVVELFENEAPQTVANFISLVESGFYNDKTFHRVLPQFMAQGGCSKGDGTGGPGYTIYCETDNPERRTHFAGTLSMAHAGKNTGGSQFFITFLPTPFLNGKHTAFGRVLEGWDVLAKLQRRDPQAAPPLPTPDKIVKATVVRKRDHEYAPKKVTD